MSQPPQSPKIYHITHVQNLPSIVTDGGLWSDAALLARGGPAESIGMGSIKRRRLGLPVRCFAGDFVGGYVPFYFCPRSIMLFLIHCANHAELTYRGGQAPILHLEFDLYEVMTWANGNGRRWAFSLSNAGAAYTEFRNRPDQLNEINWDAVANTDFRNPSVKEGKQAEFLVAHFVPWQLVRRVGAMDRVVQGEAMRRIGGAGHRPAVEVCRAWYY